MSERVASIVALCGAILIAALCSAPEARAAGAVEMQVERIVRTAIREYNGAMQAGDPADWIKYFTEDVKRSDPAGTQQGKQDFAAHYAKEFAAFNTQWTPRRVIVMGRSAAVEFEWSGTRRNSSEPVKVDMVVILELASSGKFDSIAFYYDTARVAGTGPGASAAAQ
ncbi:MAG: nuclear transport factor 2 family protein [Burkholderiales bacterium]|nr:nuclear transport factor 2 family protein [Burkholderiales bacterium]